MDFVRGNEAAQATGLRRVVHKAGIWVFTAFKIKVGQGVVAVLALSILFLSQCATLFTVKAVVDGLDRRLSQSDQAQLVSTKAAQWTDLIKLEISLGQPNWCKVQFGCANGPVHID